MEELETLAAADAGLELAVGRQLLAVALQQHIEGVFLPLETEDDVFGLRLVDALDERVLDEPEDRHLVVRGEAPVAARAREVDAHPVLVDECLNIAAARRPEGEVAEDHRPPPGDETPPLLHGLVRRPPRAPAP